MVRKYDYPYTRTQIIVKTYPLFFQIINTVYAKNGK